MRIANERELKRLCDSGRLGQSAKDQIQAELSQCSAVSAGKAKAKAHPLPGGDNKRPKAKTQIDQDRSPAELALRPVLADAFGWWQEGGELVEELEPFSDRQVRVDFALPRWQIYIEVDGWKHHGAFLEAHHDDRERGVLFSARNWLPFRVSYHQAVKDGGWLVESIREAMTIRAPWEEGVMTVAFRQTAKSGQWCRLQWRR